MAERRLGRVAGLVSLATLLSRLLGLAREQIFAALLGASSLADAYIAAFRVPNLLRDLLAEGALSQAFVPAFRAERTHRGADAAYRLANRVAGNVVVVVGALVAIAIAFAPELVQSLVGEYARVPGKLELTTELTRIMLPFLVLASLSAVAMGMQQAQEQYAAPALAPATFNVVAIAVGIALHVAGFDAWHVAVGWAVGTLLAGSAQLAIQLPSLWRLGYRPRLGLDLALRDPGVRRVVVVMLPAIVAAAAVQLNVFVNTAFASSEPGAVSWLSYAFRFLQLPIGVFGVAIATVSTTRYADAAAHGDPARLARHLVEGLRLVLFLCVPAAVGLVALDSEIIRLIYQHGRFGARDTAETATALECYAIGLPAYAAVKILAPAFYALGRVRIAVIGSVTAIAGNLAANALLHDHFGFPALALGTALAAVTNAAILYTAFHRDVAPLPHRDLATHLARILAAAAVMGAAAWGAARGLERLLDDGHAARAVIALVPVVVGGLVYGGAAIVLGIAEAEPVVARLRRRRR